MSSDFLKGKKVLLTGATGFLGANTLEELLGTGAIIRATVHEKAPAMKAPGVEYVEADLTVQKDCERVVQGIEYVIMNAAATAGAPVMFNNPLAIVTPNVAMNAFMMQAAYDAGVKKFLFISSNAVYPPYDHPMKEDEMMSGPPFEKYFPVSWMKRFGEIMAETYSTWLKEPMLIVVIRPANMYGPLDNFDLATSHVVPALIRKVIEHRNPVEVWGDGKEIKDLIYIKDFVRGMLLAFEKINTYDPLNIGTGIQVTVTDVVDAAIEADGFKDAKVFYDSSKPVMLGKRLLDVSKAERIIGFRAETPLKEGIRKTVEWYKKTYPNGYH